MKMLVAVLLLASSLASPTPALPYHPAGLDHPWIDSHGQIQISAARARALRECNAIAAQYSDPDWGNMPIYQYRACMAEHGQVE